MYWSWMTLSRCQNRRMSSARTSSAMLTIWWAFRTVNHQAIKLLFLPV